MPYTIEKKGRGYFVMDKSGHRFSKKPLTKEKARSQQIAIALSEARRTGKDVGRYFF